MSAIGEWVSWTSATKQFACWGAEPSTTGLLMGGSEVGRRRSPDGRGWWSAKRCSRSSTRYVGGWVPHRSWRLQTLRVRGGSWRALSACMTILCTPHFQHLGYGADVYAWWCFPRASSMPGHHPWVNHGVNSTEVSGHVVKCDGTDA